MSMIFFENRIVFVNQEGKLSYFKLDQSTEGVEEPVVYLKQEQVHQISSDVGTHTQKAVIGLVKQDWGDQHEFWVFSQG